LRADSRDNISEIAIHCGLPHLGRFGVEGDGSTMWRWTNGNAILPITTNEDPLILEVQVALSHAYVLEPMSPPGRAAA
jgi:hypothetical protein